MAGSVFGEDACWCILDMARSKDMARSIDMARSTNVVHQPPQPQPTPTPAPAAHLLLTNTKNHTTTTTMTTTVSGTAASIRAATDNETFDLAGHDVSSVDQVQLLCSTFSLNINFVR
jgi:hypothetical protein